MSVEEPLTAEETVEERLSRRRAVNPQRERQRRASETVTQREVRLSRRRAQYQQRSRERRASETATEREARLVRQRAQYQQRANERRASETAAEREARLARRRLRDRATRGSQSLEQRVLHLRQVLEHQ